MIDLNRCWYGALNKVGWELIAKSINRIKKPNIYGLASFTATHSVEDGFNMIFDMGDNQELVYHADTRAIMCFAPDNVVMLVEYVLAKAQLLLTEQNANDLAKHVEEYNFDTQKKIDSVRTALFDPFTNEFLRVRRPDNVSQDVKKLKEDVEFFKRAKPKTKSTPIAWKR
jgi:hypothetical protein